jgi:hypothetical protein
MDIKAELHDIAYQAYCGTSFDPERRRDSILTELQQELREDLAELGEKAGNYEQKYIDHARNWLGRKSRCISMMITGPANFPTRRNQKANDSEHKGWEDFRQWRLRYIKAVNRVHNLSPEDDMDLAIKKVDKLMINQEKMKGANKILRNKKYTDDQKIAELVEIGFLEKHATVLLEPDCMGTISFASFSLTRNNAKIKAAKDKVEIMKRRISVKEEFEPIPFHGGIIDIEADRVIIKHDEKPERDVIDKIKSRGFHWSRTYGSWSRKHTANALYTARELMGVL